jgi:putative AbiEi antitoxin of type IV toxin-antitoxin system
MSRRSALAALGERTSEQWGMVTAGQARRLGVSRVDLNRLVHDGILETVPESARVYRLVGGPEDPDRDAARAVWLQLGRDRTWEERQQHPKAIASHRTAAHLRNLGDLIARRHEFYVTTRHRLARDDVQLRVRRPLQPTDWSWWDGLPVTTPARTVADLLADREDESAVAQVCQDALRDGLLTRAQLLEAVRGQETAYGHRSPHQMAATLAGRYAQSAEV